MGSKGVGSIFILSLNLLFVSTLVFAKPSPTTQPPPSHVTCPSTPPPVVAPSTPPPVIAPSIPPPVIAPTTPPRNCQILNLGVCANVLNLVDVAINPETNNCCTLISGLVDLEASVCLCAAINANVLGLINLDVNVALGIILNRCERTRPTNFICSAPSTPPPMIAPSTPPVVDPSTPPPVVAPATPPVVIAPSTPPPAVAPTTPPRNCQILNLGVCANVLNLVDVAINPETNNCCTLISGLVDLEASVCLCAAINANVLGLINLDVNVALGIILNRCERTRPTNFICSAPSTPPPMIAPSIPPVVDPSTPPPMVAPSTPPPVVAPATPPAVIAPSTPPPAVAPTTPPRNCQILNLGICANVLNLVDVAIDPETNNCCTLISGLVDLEASVCLCAAINANVLGLINLDVNVALGIILNRCERTRPTTFICSAPSTPPPMIAPSTPPVVAPSTPPPVVAPSTPPPVIAPSTPPPVIAPSTPPPVVAPMTPPRNCQSLNLSVCANVLDLANVLINPRTNRCCTLIRGLVDLEASVCLCAAINANVLGLINLDVNVALGIILNRCERTRPTNFSCRRT